MDKVFQILGYDIPHFEIIIFTLTSCVKTLYTQLNVNIDGV